MELLVGALVVVGVAASIIRFLPRTPDGQVIVPRVVDDSIGMWLLRRATGRSLGTTDPDALAVPDAARIAFAVGVATPSGAAGVTGASRSATGPDRPVRHVVLASSHPVAELAARQARRTAAARRQRSVRLWQRRVAAFGGVAAFLVVCTAVGMAIGSVTLTSADRGGGVLAATGTPGPSAPATSGSPLASVAALASSHPVATSQPPH